MLATAAPPAAPLALRTDCSLVDLLGAALAPGATLGRDAAGAFVLRLAAGPELTAANLGELILEIGARLGRLPARPKTTVRLSPGLVLGYHSVRYLGEGIGAFLRAAATTEIGRRRALFDVEKVGHA